MIIKDIIYFLQDLLSVHSMQGNSENREIKDCVCRLAFALMDNLRSQDEEEFSKHVKEDCFVYCYTKEKIELLQKLEGDIYLCTSKNEGDYSCVSLSGGHYRFLYRFHIKKGGYGIDLNTFFENSCKIKKSEKALHWNKGGYHPNENEVIVKLKDVDNIEKMLFKK